MHKSTFEFDFSDLGITVAQIEKLLGYKEGESHESVSFLISDAFEEAVKICTIKAEYAIYDSVEFADHDKVIGINEILFDVKKIVYSQMKDSESIAVFLCTAGDEITIRTRDILSAGDPLTGFIYDTIGSVIVDAAADLMQRGLEGVAASEGLKITNRYSPGYCGWDVSEQHKLFQLIPDNFCGIKLTASALMDPVKSASGFIGIGENVRYNSYTCELCGMKTCTYRKEREVVPE